MKAKISLHITLWCIALSSVAQNHKAAKYNNKIIEEQLEVTPMIVSFMHMQNKHNTNKDYVRSELERQKIENELDRCIKRLKAMKAFEGDTVLREAALEWFLLYRRSFDVEYEEMIALLYKKDQTESDVARINMLKAKLISEEEQVDDNLSRVQEEFAVKYQLTLKKVDYEDEDHVMAN